MNKLLLTIALLSGIVYGQVAADLTIENQEAVGTDFFFDIYLTRTGTEDIYLGTGDLVLTFNSSAFTGDTLIRSTSAFWNLTSTSGNPVGPAYRTVTLVAPIVGNEIIINLNQVAFSDQTEFDDNVARINNLPNTHRLGRYRVATISDPSAFMNLQWKITGTGVTTRLFTLDPISWQSSQININAINPPIAPLPVELSSFTAKASGNEVHLNWETKTEVNNFGFDVERASSSTSPLHEWTKIGFVEGNGNSNSPKEYSFSDKKVSAGNYSYRLKQIDTDGQFEYSPEVNAVVEVPTDYALEQNFPNPFNPTTTIKFSIPEAGIVKLTIYNLLGQEVKTMVDEQRQAGSYAELFDASGLNSGVYFYELRVNDFVLTKKMQLLK